MPGSSEPPPVIMMPVSRVSAAIAEHQLGLIADCLHPGSAIDRLLSDDRRLVKDDPGVSYIDDGVCRSLVDSKTKVGALMPAPHYSEVPVIRPWVTS